MDVSVIIPTYNRVQMLEEALASVFNQDFQGTREIIVVDDGSSDGTSERVRQKYPEVRLVRFPENRGLSKARNHGLSEAQGEYVAYLDDDDLWEKDYLKAQTFALKASGQSFVVSGIVEWDTIRGLKNVCPQIPDLKKYTSMIHHMLVASFIRTPSSVIIPRTVFDKVGRFDESLRIAEDYDFYLRCLLGGYRPIFTELPVAIRRLHKLDQITSSKSVAARHRYRLLRVKKFYPLVKKQCAIVSLQRIYSEVHNLYKHMYFSARRYEWWLWCSFLSRFYRWLDGL